MPNPDAELISTKEASSILGESIKNTLRRVEAEQLTPVKKLPGLRGAYIFDRAEVEKLSATLKTPAGSAA